MSTRFAWSSWDQACTNELKGYMVGVTLSLRTSKIPKYTGARCQSSSQSLRAHRLIGFTNRLTQSLVPPAAKYFPSTSRVIADICERPRGRSKLPPTGEQILWEGLRSGRVVFMVSKAALRQQKRQPGRTLSGRGGLLGNLPPKGLSSLTEARPACQSAALWWLIYSNIHSPDRRALELSRAKFTSAPSFPFWRRRSISWITFRFSF